MKEEWPARLSPVGRRELAQFCRRWRVVELAVFGSVLREDFGRDSDIDLLVTFEPGACWSLMDIARMTREGAGLFGRPVDVVERQGVESHHNPWRRSFILRHHQTIYTAA
ncbi:MAG: DNA polymerase subunit beta [Planctomycetota bacterium]|nr:MAG: DNA polymerase subunit beta [Planctomycetota bacterium]